MTRVPVLIAAMLFGSASAFAADTAQNAADAGNTDNAELPDAMQHMVKAPPMDLDNLRDPFASYLAMVARRGQRILQEKRLQLANRPREVLENFDLATLKLVGIYKQGEERVAMVQDATGKGYIVRRGNYMGTNNGRIEKIDNNTVYLVEQVLNPAGEIVDHQVTLTLKEVND
jgi:type IV pilus assembly protein PilP